MTPSGPKKGVLIIATPKGDEGPAPLSSPEDQMPDEQIETEGDQHCGNCKFYEPETSYCVRFPPKGMEWPTVTEDNFCGEWRGGPNHVPHNSQSEESPDPQSMTGQPPMPGMTQR